MPHPTARSLLWQMAEGKVHTQQKREERKARRHYAKRSASAAAWEWLAAAEADQWSQAVHHPPSMMSVLCYVVALSRAQH